MIEELRKAWERFWALSWWWKGGAFGVTGFILLAIIASATSGGDDASDNGTATPTPTPTVLASETEQPSATGSPTASASATGRTTASPTPSASPTAEPTQPPTAAPTQPPTQPPTAAPSVQFTSIVGGPPNSNASATVQASPGAACSLSYTTPSGTISKADGLGAKTADGNGMASWTWKIGGSTNPGTGTVKVTCDGVSITGDITIG